ncbi:hypothetical protein ACHAPJ_013455 [Fusarium lateritium]
MELIEYDNHVFWDPEFRVVVDQSTLLVNSSTTGDENQHVGNGTFDGPDGPDDPDISLDSTKGFDAMDDSNVNGDYHHQSSEPEVANIITNPPIDQIPLVNQINLADRLQVRFQPLSNNLEETAKVYPYCY